MFLKILERLGRKRIIMDRVNEHPYVERYYLFLKERNWFPFNVFLHKFLKGDPDDVHNHPWPHFTIVLKGGYYEWIPIFDRKGRMVNEIRRWCGPGHARIRSSDSFHRIELRSDVTAWTLSILGPYRKNWGFLVKNEWMPHQIYSAKR